MDTAFTASDKGEQCSLIQIVSAGYMWFWRFLPNS